MIKYWRIIVYRENKGVSECISNPKDFKGVTVLEIPPATYHHLGLYLSVDRVNIEELDRRWIHINSVEFSHRLAIMNVTITIIEKDTRTD